MTPSAAMTSRDATNQATTVLARDPAGMSGTIVPLLARGRPALAGDRVARYRAREFLAAGHERDLRAVQAAVRDRGAAERARHDLELLRERERAAGHLPRALDLGRHDPQHRR